MQLWQALLIALLGYLGANQTPWFFSTTGGWYVLGRPLVAGTLIGWILGDVQTGVLAGAAVQAMYIGLVTPGGAMPADINFAAYIGIPLALVSNGSPEYAVTLALPLSFIGVAIFNLTMSLNAFFVHKGDKYAEEGNVKGIALMNIMGTLPTFILRFSIIFLACYYGAPFAEELTQVMPEILGKIFIALGGILPSVGFALLLQQSLKENKMIVFYLLGFVISASLNMTILSITTLAIVIAVLDVAYRKTNY